MEIDQITGLPKSTHIEYFLGDKSLGKTMVSEKSNAVNRINGAKSIGIEYYDRFILDNGRIDSNDVKFVFDGVLEPLDDFKVLNKHVD